MKPLSNLLLKTSMTYQKKFKTLLWKRSRAKAMSSTLMLLQLLKKLQVVKLGYFKMEVIAGLKL